MSRTSRNTLMIGGALILIALLLVCGPLSGRFGSAGPAVEEPPSVASGPPPDAGATLGLAASGAMAGATLGEIGDERVAMTSDDPCDRNRADADAASDVVREGTDCPPVVGAGATVSDLGVGAGTVVAAGVAVAAGATTVAATAGGSGGLGRGHSGANASSMAASPPPVSAGVPSTPVSAARVIPAVSVVVGAAATASGAFDHAIVSVQHQNGGVGPAGRIVDRFAPPVAAPSNPGIRVASALKSGPLILPCDLPGSGCRNPSAGAGLRPPGGLNPPIIPGGRPPGPTGNNPPIVPGAPPTRIP